MKNFSLYAIATKPLPSDVIRAAPVEIPTPVEAVIETPEPIEEAVKQKDSPILSAPDDFDWDSGNKKIQQIDSYYNKFNSDSWL